MLQMQNGPGLSIPSLVPCYDEQSCMTNAPSRPQFCTPSPQNGYHSGRVLQEMMYQNEVNYQGFMSDHRGNQSLQSSWSPPWAPRQNVPYLAHTHPGTDHTIISGNKRTYILLNSSLIGQLFTNYGDIIRWGLKRSTLIILTLIPLFLLLLLLFYLVRINNANNYNCLVHFI